MENPEINPYTNGQLIFNRGFPDSPVVKNPHWNSGDSGLSSGLHMLWSNEACAPQLLSLRSTAQEPPYCSLCA